MVPCLLGRVYEGGYFLRGVRKREHTTKKPWLQDWSPQAFVNPHRGPKFNAGFGSLKTLAPRMDP